MAFFLDWTCDAIVIMVIETRPSIRKEIRRPVIWRGGLATSYTSFLKGCMKMVAIRRIEKDQLERFVIIFFFLPVIRYGGSRTRYVGSADKVKSKTD